MKKDSKALLWRILGYLKPFKKQFAVVGVALVVSTIVGFLQPLTIQSITDDGMLQKDMGIIVRSALVLAVLVLINQSIDLLQTRIFADIHNASYYTIFHTVFQKLLHLKKSYFQDKNNAEILSFLQMDVMQVSSITDRYIVLSISHVFRIISGLIGLVVISWRLALVVLAMVPLKFLLVRVLSRRREKNMNENIESSREFSRWFGDNLNGVEEIKLWNLSRSKEKSFKQQQEKVLNIQRNGVMIDAWNTFFEILLEWGVTILLYLLGGALICTGSLTIGAVFAFVSYSSYVTGPVASLINLKMYFARILPSARRLFKFLDMETERDEGEKWPASMPPQLELRDVTFSYDEQRTILNGVNLVIEPGEKVAIIGQNGSGKSTLLNLLLRFYEPTDGAILADGINIQEMLLEEYRNLFAVVSQEPYLFLGDILENVDLAENAQSDKLLLALERSGVAGFLDKLPMGAKTKIGRNGAKLSGGEKQKLAVARALLKDAPIVILDEATSGFDVESDAYLHDILLHEMKDKTVIMITHHYHNLKGMDRVLKLVNGDFEEVAEHISE